MLKSLTAMLRDDEGATMVEYGVIVALIAAVCIAVITTIGTGINNAFGSVNSKL
jgi:pilus assembly protein Flp/PilA